METYRRPVAVLVIEADAFLRGATVAALEAGGHAAHGVPGFERAIAYLSYVQPDAIVIGSPPRDAPYGGPIWYLRSAVPGVPLILVGAAGTTRGAADAVVWEPVDADELDATLRALVRAAPGRAAPQRAAAAGA